METPLPASSKSELELFEKWKNRTEGISVLDYLFFFKQSYCPR